MSDTMPASLVQDAPPVLPAELPSRPVVGAPQPLHVLFVDASVDAFEPLAGLLRSGGFDVSGRCVDGRAGLRAALRDASWDLVLARAGLPGLPFAEIESLVRGRDPDLPLVALSAHPAAGEPAGTPADDHVYVSNPARLLPVVERQLAQTVLRRGSRLAAQAVHRAESALRESEARFLQLAANIPECFWLIDVALKRVVYVNAAYEQIWGRRVEDLYEDRMDWLRHVHPDDAPRVADAARRSPLGGFDEDFRTLRPDGSLRWLHVRTFPIRDETGAVRSVGGVASDVTSFVDQQQRLTHLAHYDSLTALPNRLLFYERLSGAVALARRNGRLLGVLFVDLDRFKNINDTLGHIAGDELLRQVAGRLSGCLRASDTVGRLGGDEFAVILPELDNGQHAAIVARKIIDALTQPMHLEGEDVFVSASIGITLFPDDADDLHTLLRHADTAMYRAKDAGRNNYQFFTSSMNDQARERLQLETDLRHALLREEFVLHYQPKVSCSSGRIVGVEALIRWQHPVRGLVPPSDFIPLLEETGLIVQVGQWVLRSACVQAQAWRAAGLDLPNLAVNVSGRQLQSELLVEEVAGALRDSGLPAEVLELELTESMLMHNAEAAVRTLHRLKATGVRLAVDDFGTGYSSLSYLKRFPLDAIKVDRAFVQDIAADPDDASITRAVITMAHHLKLKVVAEGVETEGQLSLLVANRCDQIQGYYFSRPLPADALEALLREGRSLPSGLLRCGERPRVVLFAGPVPETLAVRLGEACRRVLRAPDAAQAHTLLAGHRVDAVLVRGDAEGVETLRVAQRLQPDAERMALCDAAAWGRIGEAFAAGIVQRCFPLATEGGTLFAALEPLLQARERSEAALRPGEEALPPGSERLRLTEAVARLEAEVASLRARGDTALGLLQEFTQYIPWPLLGVDDEGMIALSNGPADALFAEQSTLLGQYAGEVLPPALLAVLGAEGEARRGEAVRLGHRDYRVHLKPLDRTMPARGRLLLLIPEEAS